MEEILMTTSLKLVLVADTFHPLRNSGAIQLQDLACEMAAQGHKVTVIIPSHTTTNSSQIQQSHGYRVLKLKAPKTKDINYISRTLNEIAMPYFMIYNLRRSDLKSERWDGVIWYSPSIFHGPLIKFLKKANQCKSYLILRDIFPDWALEVGLIKKGPIYQFFAAVAAFQYSLSDVIGVQTEGNLKYIKDITVSYENKVEVLPNWLGNAVQSPCTIRVNDTLLAGRTIFVYAGNMGVAQGMDILIELAYRFEYRRDLGFLFVGRGDAVKKLKEISKRHLLTNTLFYDEIEPTQITDLYAQCHIGMIALDSRHKSHNIPGKFLSYLQSGLPVLANVNKGNDIAHLIRDQQVGQVCDINNLDKLVECANLLIEQVIQDKQISDRCRALFNEKYSVEKAGRQVVAQFSQN